MERERLNHLMQDPAHVAKEDLAGLQELTARYPWFSAAHLLLAVGEHAVGDVLYDERAHTSAAHLPDRSVLHDLVHAAPADVPPPPPPVVWVPPVAEMTLIVPEAPAVTPPVATEPPLAPAAPVEPIVVAPPPVAAVTPVVPAEVVPVVELPVEMPGPETAPAMEEAPVPVAEGPPAAPEAPEADPLDQLFRETAYATSYELLLEHEALPPPAPPEPVPVPQRPGKRRFTDWLEGSEAFALVPGTTAVEGPRKDEPAPPPAAVAATAPTLPAEPAVPEQPAAPAKPKAGMSVSEAASLIDRFIRQETPDHPKRAAFFNPQTAAKRSLEEHAELVTETLARIYAKQGNLAKAKAAYRRLAEKHPERRDHFLAELKALDERPKA